jgi:hypothetical protein
MFYGSTNAKKRAVKGARESAGQSRRAAPGTPSLDSVSSNRVEPAVAGGAAMLITHNVSDFAGELKFPGAQVVTPGQFLRLKR